MSTINRQSVDILTHKKFLETFFSGLVHMPGKGVNESITEDTNAAYVRVVRQNLPGFEPRRLGSTVNGGSFNSDDAAEPSSVEYELSLTDLYDGNFDIAEVTTDMFSLPLVERTMEDMAGEVDTAVNAATLAEQLRAWANSAAKNEGAQKITLPAEIGDTTYREAVFKAGAILDDGDIDNGVQFYPADQREIIARPMFCAELFSKWNLGAGDITRALLERGVISEGTYKSNGEMFVGEIDNTPVYKAPSVIWKRAAKELCFSVNGVPSYARSNSVHENVAARSEMDKIEAIVVSAVGTVRGLALGNHIKSIDSPRGAGIRLQPKFRYGVETLYGTSVVPIVKNGFDLTKLTAYTSESDNRLLVRMPVKSQTA
ncbi:MAG: hypothetical protein E7663_04755 [Ruminococcaceae bacterium]|nr:hypothetical protein [Oscillospiraceae bacterium]